MYKLQNMGNTNSLTGWSWQADLTAAQMEKVVSEEGVTFSVKLVGSDAQLWVDGSKLKTVDLPDAYADKLAKIKIAINGNNDTENIVIPFIFG